MSQTPQQQDLEGSTALVTGGASGIGLAAARALAGSGAHVVVADVDEAGLAKTAASLSGPVLSRVLDVRDAADQLRFADEVRTWLPAELAAVFNNAGVAGGGRIDRCSIEEWQWITDINLFGVVRGTRAFVPLLKAQGSGHLVNVASLLTQSAHLVVGSVVFFVFDDSRDGVGGSVRLRSSSAVRLDFCGHV